MLKGSCTILQIFTFKSLISTNTTLIEQLLGNRLKNLFEAAQLIPKKQTGFRPGRSNIDGIFTFFSALHIYIFS